MSAVFTDGNWIESKDQSDSGIRLVQTGNVGIGQFKDRSEKARFIDEATFMRLKCFEVLPGDLLISRLPDPVGRACIIPDTGQKMITAVDCSILRVRDAAIDPQFLVYYTQTQDYLHAVDARCSGTTRRRISRKNLGNVPVPTPSLDEQKRIVAVLDQAFAALDRARAHAEANLADALELFDNALMATFDELLATAEMITLSEAADDFSRGKSRHRPRNDPKLYDGDYPFIQTGDIRRSEGAIREYSQTYNEAGLAQSKLWPVGTVCITIAANIAETGVLEFEACFPDSVIGMVPTPVRANAYYVEYMLRYFAKDLKLQGKGSAQDNINLATFESAKFPFPPLEQQMAVVDKLDSLATEVASLRSNYRRTLTDLANLRQSLLQKAFSGGLA